MRVAYFSNQLVDQEGHGLARYARELLCALASVEGVEMIPTATWRSCSDEDLKLLAEQYGFTLLPWGRRVTPLAWSIFRRPLIERWLREAQVVHAVSLGYRISTKLPLVVTVHDIGPLTHPEYFRNKPYWIMRDAVDMMVKKAARIICVSTATAESLKDFVGKGLSDDRIAVIGEGISPIFKLEGEQLDSDPYLLMVGQLSPRKNVERAILAFESVSDQIPHRLRIIGGAGWDNGNVRTSVKSSSVVDRVSFEGFVDDAELCKIYCGASAYLHPSLFEGFGLTILEAMACGCPVITSNVSSLPEVAGNAAVLVDPFDVDSLAESILLVCTDRVLADRLRNLGLKRSEAFSWEQVAREVACIYESVA